MNGRSYALILFFWALLTVVTPTLVRMSSSAKPSLDSNREKAAGIMASGRVRGLLPRRALVAIAQPDQAPALAPTLEPDFGLKFL